MTGHVVSFEPAGAPTRAVCSCGWNADADCGAPDCLRCLADGAELHAFRKAPDSRIEFAGLPPVERAS